MGWRKAERHAKLTVAVKDGFYFEAGPNGIYPIQSRKCV